MKLPLGNYIMGWVVIFVGINLGGLALIDLGLISEFAYLISTFIFLLPGAIIFYYLIKQELQENDNTKTS